MTRRCCVTSFWDTAEWGRDLSLQKTAVGKLNASRRSTAKTFPTVSYLEDYLYVLCMLTRYIKYTLSYIIQAHSLAFINFALKVCFLIFYFNSR